MTLQHALFSFNGRLGRRDFWLWMVSWLILMVVDFFFAAQEWITYQSAGFTLVVLLWPTAAVLVKRLHDRNKSAWWALLFVLAWMLVAGNWAAAMPQTWSWVLGRLAPSVIFIMLLIDCGAFTGTPGANRFGPEPDDVKFR